MEKAYSSKNYYLDHLTEKQTMCLDLYRGKPQLLKCKVQCSELPEATNQFVISNGALRLTALFFKVLDKQFPIKLLNQKMKCRFPMDFAGAAAVHVNHLNKSLKDITGKTTSQLIAVRIAKEAQTLLKLTEWNVCEIGYCLGFEEGPHFINFFKKNTNMSPTAYRKKVRSQKATLMTDPLKRYVAPGT